ncbi:hypothetical protein [Aeromonas veronii]|uniref:hypothetical protein n=1 Tax=Aeromonas veronii TaxID=654 RepID=UPI000D1F0734|nr:hypothetical protein [Aeromonas veronii]
MLKTLKLNGFLSISVVCVTVCLLQGCGDTIDCNGTKEKEDVIKIIHQELSKAVWHKEMSLAFSGTPELKNIKMLAKNDDLQQGQCNAKYSFIYNQKPHEVDVNYNLAHFEDNGNTEVVVYIESIKAGLIGLALSSPPIKNTTEKFIDKVTGKTIHTIEWKNNKKNGEEIFFDITTGKIKHKIEWKNNSKHGNETLLDKDGKTVLIDINWIDGKANGFEKRYNPKRTKFSTDLVWKDGKQTGIYTDYGFPYDESAYDEYHYKNGKLDGVYTSAHMGQFPDKTIIKSYKDGKLNGLSKTFYKGELIEEIMYKDGNEVKETMYRNGKVVNVQLEKEMQMNFDKCLDDMYSKFIERDTGAGITQEIEDGWKASCAKYRPDYP